MASGLPVDLLEDIFLRLDVYAACTSFRRVVSDGRFLRHFGSLHRRPVLGLLADKRRHFETEILFFPVQPPRRSALAAGVFAEAADFTFSFLPDPKYWRVCDARDGRVLLTRNLSRQRSLLELEDLVVYDPLHRRHVQIPALPGDLLLSAKQDDNDEAMAFNDPFLAPATDEYEGFRVLFTALSKSKVVALVFSSVRGQWRHGACFHNLRQVRSNLPWSRRYVHGCICWVDSFDNVMLVFDTREMKLSITDLPDESICTTKMAVEAGDGRLGLLQLSNRCMKMDLYSKALQGIQEPDEWQHDGSIPLIPGFEFFLDRAAEGYVLLRGFSGLDVCKEKREEAHYFTLELNTLQVEKLCVLKYDARRRSFLYTSFPPPLSLPSVCNCKNLSFSLPVSTTETCEYIDLAELFD